jgi:hypothetical protein
MAENEQTFRTAFMKRYGAGHLRGKRRYVERTDIEAVEISTDDSIEHDGWLVLIEVDSFNTTKPAVGQYVLLNQLCHHDALKTLFLIVHYYKGFNAKRTMKNLAFVRTLFPRQPSIHFAAFTADSFFTLCQNCPDIASLVLALTAGCRQCA